VHFAGCTAHPDEGWVTQRARQVSWTLSDRTEPVRLLIRDRDRKFTRRFDEVFQGSGIRVVRTPIQAPQANGIAERFVRTVRSECLDWLLVLNARHAERVLAVFIDHYNRHRAHRSLKLMPPDGRSVAEHCLCPQPVSGDPQGSARRCDTRVRACSLSQREFVHRTPESTLHGGRCVVCRRCSSWQAHRPEGDPTPRDDVFARRASSPSPCSQSAGHVLGSRIDVALFPRACAPVCRISRIEAAAPAAPGR
jgi:hypothetical protein